MTRPNLEIPLSFDVAVRMISFDLFAQINNQHNKKKRAAKSGIPVTFMTDAIINADTGEEIELNSKITEIMKIIAENSFSEFSVAEMNSENINNADYVIIGVIRYEEFNNQKTTFPHLFLSAVDMKSSQILAHSEVWIASQEMKLQPTPLYSDSPMFMKDNRAEKVIETAQAASGSVVDEKYVSSLETNGLLAEASTAYNEGNYPLAVELFSKAASRDDGQVMKTYAGLYQAHIKLEHLKEAEEAFAKLVEIGIKNGTLSVKFLFQVGDTSFFGKPEEIIEYDIWLRQIAKKITESQSCVEISGHASKSGSAEFNKKLSDKRARTIQQRLIGISSVITGKTVAIGYGFEQNIAGSGTDDMRDSIDRRVEFKVMDCQK